MLFTTSKHRLKYLFLIILLIIQSGFIYCVYTLHYTVQYKNGNALTVIDQSKSSKTYKFLLEQFSVSNLKNLPLKDRCHTYFNKLYEMDKDWSIGDFNGLEYSLNLENEKRFYNERYATLKKEYTKEKKNIDEIKPEQIFEEFKRRKEMNTEIEERLTNAVGHLRIYGSCYLQNNIKNDESQCLDIEARLFPWLTFESPIFERWNGTIINDFPNIADYYQYDDGTVKNSYKTGSYNKGENPVDQKGNKVAAGSNAALSFSSSSSSSSSNPFLKNNLPLPGESCYFNTFKEKLNGRGIVISMGDQFAREAINLLKILRYHKNVLPIQFVHKGDLAQETKQRLIRAARGPMKLKGYSSIEINDYPQEIWFVDTKRCFADSYYYKFSFYANKWLAVLFNSFQEMILMDADSVPFIKPVDFLDIEDYKKTGCHFFRDRETLEQFPDVFKKIFYNLFPRDIETVLFGIPQLTPHTLENKFFKHNARHFVESGIVLMDRKSHLLGMLMSIHLQFWGPLNTFLYGEKEIFWLGQSIAGNEQYSYNINPVGAIGPITTSEHKIADSAISVQPAHIGSDNHTLLWVNSGLETCKRHSWTHDFKNNRKLNKEFGSEDNLKNHYLSPLQIDGVIIPPDATRYYDNKINEPKRGWEQRSDLGCEGYLWAAYSNVGDDKNGARGKEVRFSEDEKKYYNKIASIWTSELDE